ncbi:hypothetical protein HX052_13505 [Myroides marinus]|uniref:Uncharacterized protein n=1 Tax=Myroides marinus TaxID=703342 RepID=A0A1H6XBW3_9FLAO|nr:hypothetical protein [Myroides marinus]MDM1361066.1 hypothetical protein [Myroides marinus]MDM1378026.1 hypothetical protein [Myroides marinus]MDM1385297.1 hypothetical protein [Myroides marinus]MDM1390973.1 hypothetical protein [Myroides marinus]MDM1392510.1 hypothetical protein [Myroides marinus]
MKKITLIAALLGSVYFANAQVGIGTPDPATSAELDIVAKAGNKGILIPRVDLKNTKDFQMAGKSAESTSLLVFNRTEVKDLVPTGFYYWDGAKWNRIVGKEELDTVIKNLGDNITNITTKLEGDVKNLKAVINYILPSNPDNKDDKGNPVVNEKHTTIVYNPDTKEMFYVTYDGGKYTTQKIDITKMVQGVETNTFFTEIKDANGKVTGYVYFNESTIVKALNGETDATKIKEILANLDATTPGAISIDVKGTVVNNFKEILEAPTTITVTTKEGDKTFTTVEEYLQYISQSADGNVIYKNIGDDKNPNWVFQYYNKADGKYVTISLRDLVAGTETKTFVKEISENGKVTGFVYFSEQTIIDWLAADKGNTVDNIPNDAKGAITVDVKGTVVNNIQEILKSTTSITEGGKTFTTVEEYLQYISQSADGNVIYTNLGDDKNPNWVFQYYDKNTGKYETINLRDLVAGTESKTTIVTYNNKQYYLSEAYIVGGGELDVTKWIAVPTGAIHVDVVGGVINNIEEILTTKGNITIQVGGKDMTFTSVEEYLQYITQFSEGNVIYKNISTDPAKPNWVLQYWDNTANEYKTINLTDLVAAVETKTNILRTESKADGTLEAFAAVVAPVEANVKVGEIFYKYNNEDKGEQFINMTADILTSINNNEEIKKAITNVLNQGGNVYYGDHDNDPSTDEAFYKIVDNKNVKIDLPVSFLLEIINKYKDVIKQALGDNITNEGDIVFTGNIYNGRQVMLVKGSTSTNGESARTTGVTLANATGDNAINGVLSIKILKAGVVVTESTKDVVVTDTKIDFNIGVGNIYTALPAGDYEVVVEYLGKEVK